MYEEWGRTETGSYSGLIRLVDYFHRKELKVDFVSFVLASLVV